MYRILRVKRCTEHYFCDVSRIFGTIPKLVTLHSFYRYTIRTKRTVRFIMRLLYIEDSPGFENKDDQAIVERIRQRRGENGLIALDRALLHAPPIADGW